MATLINGLGGTAGYGEQSIKVTGLTSGNLDDGTRMVDVTSVFGAGGLNLYGTRYTNIYINTNGIITFNSHELCPHSIDSTWSAGDCFVLDRYRHQHGRRYLLGP